MAPTTLFSPTLGARTPDSAHPPSRRMQVASEFLEGERDYSCLPAMEWMSLLDHNPTSSPWPMQVTGLHHTTCSILQRLASGYLLACEKGADLQLPHQGCLRRT